MPTMRLIWIAVGVAGIALLLGGASGLTRGAAVAADDTQTTYFQSGQIQTRFTRIDGQREGAASEWYANGQERCAGEYLHGEREGAWVFFHSDGSIDAERTGTYVQGKRVSP